MGRPAAGLGSHAENFRPTPVQKNYYYYYSNTCIYKTYNNYHAYIFQCSAPTKSPDILGQFGELILSSGLLHCCIWEIVQHVWTQDINDYVMTASRTWHV